MDTCPFGYADHFEPVECQLVNTRQFEPCYRFDPVCFLNELLPVDTGNCILLDTNLDLLADTATKASKLLPKREKRVMFSDKAPQIREFDAPMSENECPPLPWPIDGEDIDDDEDLKLNKLSLFNKQINTLSPKVNDHVLRRSVKVMPKLMVAKEQKINYMGPY